jgi:hypothetical protein
MSTKTSIRFFNDKEVCAVWDEAGSKWWFSVVDIVSAITDGPRPRGYWGTLKSRLKEQGNQLYSKCIQLKSRSDDGKSYATLYKNRVKKNKQIISKPISFYQHFLLCAEKDGHKYASNRRSKNGET